MTRRTQAPRESLAKAAAFLVMFGWAWMSPLPASAQLGSLIVTITSPSSGFTVSGTLPVDASVTIVGSLTVAGVQFYVDGTPLGTEDTSAPYSRPWDTTTASNGSHTLTAVARDILGVRWTSDPVTVTVSNDKTSPTVTINQAATQADPTSTTPITFTAVFSEPVSGFTGSDVTIGGTAGGTKTVTVSGGPSTYTVAVSGMTTGGTVIATTPAGGATDAAGNGNTASTSTDNTVTFSPPDTTAPTVTITSPSGGATVSGTITVTADASDNVGVAGVQFFLDGNPLGGEDTTGPTYSVSWDTTTATNASHTLTAHARDAAGNSTTSSPVTVTVSNSTATTRIEETSTSIAYTGSWVQGDMSRVWSGGTAAFSGEAAARATLSFTGTGVSWIGFRGPQTGMARVFVDGTLAATVDTYSASEEVQAVMFTRTGLTSGAHTLSVEATGTKNAASTNALVVVDAFDVTTGGGGGTDTTPPTVSITSPAGGSTVSGTVIVTASASDNVGVAGVRFLVDGSQIGAEDTTSPHSASWDTTTVANGSHTLTAVTRDAAGNSTTSSPVTVTVSNGTGGGGTATRLEEDHTAITYAPPPPADWFDRFDPNYSGGKVKATPFAGSRATLTFTGTGVAWISLKKETTGIARVFLDGTLVATVDTYSATPVYQAPLFTASGLPPGTHTLAIEATGTFNPSSTTAWIAVDAFDVTSDGGAPPAAPTRSEETAADLAPAAAWFGTTTASSGVALSGDSAVVAGDAGATATFTFTGTGVSWIGFPCEVCGIADVLIDGARVGTVDTFASTRPAASTAMFSTTGLGAGSHTLVIAVTGNQNVSSGGTFIVVDAFDVTP